MQQSSPTPDKPAVVYIDHAALQCNMRDLLAARPTDTTTIEHATVSLVAARELVSLQRELLAKATQQQQLENAVLERELLELRKMQHLQAQHKHVNFADGTSDGALLLPKKPSVSILRAAPAESTASAFHFTRGPTEACGIKLQSLDNQTETIPPPLLPQVDPAFDRETDLTPPPVPQLAKHQSEGEQAQNLVLKQIGTSTFKFIAGGLILGSILVIAFTKVTGRDHRVLLQSDTAADLNVTPPGPSIPTVVNHDV
jgi:hypothetical protein